MSHDDRLLCSMHIPKTAGLSLLALLRKVYGRFVLPGHELAQRDRLQHLASSEPAMARQLRAVHGHMPWGFHTWFGRPFVYLAFVRDPVERVISYYDFCRREPTHNRHPLANELSLEAWVEANPDLCVDNAMTRFFSGRITDMAPRSLQIPPGERHAVLAEAIDNIRADFPVVGVVEDMQRSLEMCRVYFGWPDDLEMPRRNVSPSPLKASSAIRERIADLNDLDRELYAYCARRLERDYPLFCN